MLLSFYLALVLRKVNSNNLYFLGALGQITIYPGRTMKVIATVTGPLKKYVGKDLHFKLIFSFKTLSFPGKEVLVSQMRGGEDCPIKPQVNMVIISNIR